MTSQLEMLTTPPAAPAVMNGKQVYQVETKSVVNFDSGFKHKLLCDGATFSAGTACAFSCSYCYVPDMVRKLRAMANMQHVAGKHEDIVIRRSGALDTLRHQLTDRHGRPKFNGAIERGRVIYGSPLVDVAANMELVRETIQIVTAILGLTSWDVRLLSKSPLLKEVAKGLADHKSRVIYGLSTGTLDDGLARSFEPDSGLISKRLAALHWLQDNHYRTYGMLCPSLPQEHYARFAHEMAKAIRADRCEHVWAEVMNIRGESFTRTHAALVAAGYKTDADRLTAVMTDKGLWDRYARSTFLAHAGILPKRKLRFLQYVSAGTRDWWQNQAPAGAVLL